MFEAITFSLAGTIVFVIVALGLIRLMAAIGGGQRVRVVGGRSQGDGSGARRPGRTANQRARR